MRMKKKILTAITAIFVLCLEASAQWYVGGNVQFDTRFSSDGTTALDFTPDIGYSFGRWSVGASLNTYMYFNEEHALSSLQASISPYVEYYFPVNGFLSFFLEGGLGLRYSSFNMAEGKGNATFSFNPYIAPGLEVTMSEHWSVLAHIARLSFNSEQRTLFLNGYSDALSVGLYYSF